MLTIFHNPSLRTSKEALRLLQKASRRYNFEIDLIQTKTRPPTHQQVANIVEYLGNGSIDEGLKHILVPKTAEGEEIKNPSTVAEVQQILDKNPAYLRKPLIVDWNRGKALIADVKI
jgi:arsenate reductase-like glutaredoxin family protein